MGNKTVVVIGAVNMDICGRPDKEPNMRDSNPGTVSFTPGGVGRNIAHNLCLLGVSVKFIAAIGDDVYGSSIYESCEKLGMDMHMCRRMKGGRTSSYLYITDEKGDMLLGVNDTDISGSITPEYLGRHLRELNAADAVVIDANLTKETLSWIGENVTSDLYADPVSVAKAERLTPVLGRLKAFKPNEYEAKYLTNETTSLFAAEELLRRGVKQVFVSLGSDGIVAAADGEIIKLPCESTEIVNATGCGDAATAAIIWAGVNGLGLAETASAAMKAAALAAQCEQTNNPELCPELIS